MTTYKILVIDDAFFIRNLIKKAVNRKPIKNDISFEIVGEAQNGNEGLALAKELNPDIITVDFNIPELNGLDFAKYLKETNPKIPILMISSNTDPNFPKEVEDIGCHFLQKPFQESFLWMRLDGLVEEIQNFDESKIEPTISQETKDLLDEISMEVEAEIDETPIEIEEVSLPKVNKKNKPKKKKKKNTNNLFGLEIDDSIVIKPKKENLDNTNEKVESQKNDSKNMNEKDGLSNVKDSNIKKDTPIIKEEFLSSNENKVEESIEEDLKIEQEPSSIIKEDTYSINESESNSESGSIDNNETSIEDNDSNDIIIEDEDESIIIDEDDEPIVIDDEDDNVIVIDDDEEIVIENDSQENDEDEIIIGEDEEIDDKNEDVLDDENLIINSNEENVETEKDKKIKSLKDNVSYSYQNEMSYVLHVMEKLAMSTKLDEVKSDVIEEENEANTLSNLGIETPIIREEDLTKEEESEEFDKLFAEFNPNIDLSYIGNQEEKKEEQRAEVKEKLLQQAPSITQQIEIEPPKNDKVRQIYNKENPNGDDFIIPINDKPKKVSIFTKIFNFFSRHK